MILRFRLISHLLYLGVGKMVKVLDVNLVNSSEKSQNFRRFMRWR